MKWFRLYREIVDDPKMLHLSDRDFRVWIFSLSLACRDDCWGQLPFDLQSISHLCRIDLRSIKHAFQKFEELKMVEKNHNGYLIKNWEKRQFSSDSSAERTRRWRQKRVTSQERHSDGHGDAIDTDTDTDTEKTITPPTPPLSCPYQKIVELWNQKIVSPKITQLTPKRKQKLKARWREHPDLEWWSLLFTKRASTPFLRGESDRGWKADFDWFIANDTNCLKVLEGKYDGGKSTERI